MNTPALINYFAANGYLIDQAALSYIQAHDHKQILELFNDNYPETIVIDLPGIRRVKRTERKHTIVRYVNSFKPKPIKPLIGSWFCSTDTKVIP